jgi:hypothetical protein
MEPATVEFAYDYNQLYLYDAETDLGPEANAYLDALVPKQAAPVRPPME